MQEEVSKMLRLDKYNPALQSIVHYTAAFVVLTKAWSLYMLEDSNIQLVIFFIAVGLFIISFAVFRKQIIEKAKYSEGLVNVVEAMMLLYIGILYSNEGRLFIHYALYLAAFNYFVAGVLSFIRVRSGN